VARYSTYRDLEVWKKAVYLAKMIYEVTEEFPTRELYGISGQLRRSAVSVASNIAEGQARDGKKEFIYFLKVALGSLAELETQLIIGKEIGFLTEDKLDILIDLIYEVAKMIKGLLSHILSKK
jgi:four helix bundle protein